MAQVKVYLPKEASNYQVAYDMLTEHMCKEFGGFTHYDGTGGWVNDSGETVTEPVTIIESFTSESRYWAKYLMEDTIQSVSELTNEDAVAFSVNHEMFFL